MDTRVAGVVDLAHRRGASPLYAARLALAAALFALSSCASSMAGADEAATPIRVAHLAQEGGDAGALKTLSADFERRNPGYELDWRSDFREFEAGDQPVIGFLQAGSARVTVERTGGGEAVSEPELTVGDVLLLRPTERLSADSPISAVFFTVPAALPEGLPSFVRPDWDERITDTPGGCAEETGAYRRILLTWMETVGPYVYHALNCHRVRITDSFAHYHPVEGGFDEFYLVQMAQPGAVLYTSEATSRIEEPTSVSTGEAARMIDKHVLEVGDLVYLPRGTVHRGYGGVLAQIITVPGFRPGAEIGVDHYLRAINENLGLTGEAALPYREASSTRAVVK